MEDYVDDTLVKSTKYTTHLQTWESILDHMEKLSLRVNCKKCAFGVTSRKLLCYTISVKGIEVNLEKIQEIMDMPSPHNIN